MLIKWFDASEAKQFGVSLAEFLIEKMPPESSGKKQLSASKKLEVLNKVFERAEQFKVNHKLNLYKKSQFGKTFKWTLRNAGFDKEFVDKLTIQIILKLQ